MAWTADGSALADHTDFVRVVNEGGIGKRGRNRVIPGRFGLYSDPEKYWGESEILLEVGITHSDDDAVTHLFEVQKMLGASSGLVTLKRTDHSAGTVEADVELLSNPRPTQNRFTYLFPLRNPSGFWQDTAVTTVSGASPTINTAGNRPIGDSVITFSGPGTATLINAWGTCAMEYSGTGTAIVDNGARTVTKAGGAQDANFTVDQKWWFWLPEATSGVGLTATVSITVDFQNKHA